MRLIPALCWSVDAAGQAPLDPRLFELLSRIGTQGSLRAAADAIGMPYRTAWGLLQDMERTFGSPLVQLQRGRGASLTVEGAAVVRADDAARKALATELAAMVLEVGTPPARKRGGVVTILRVAASHDLALAELQDALPAATGVRLDIEFCGSLEALARFSAGDVDMAGFHFVPRDAGTARPFLRFLRPARDRLVRFVDRDQGLIVARGNRFCVNCLADVVDKRLRFVNRQGGSGTRLLIDARLAREGLDARDLRGYATEEFTHAAVAATIASGRADVGFGVAAAAAEYNLGFVPLAREHYYFAVREAIVRSAPVVALRQSLTGPIFKQLVGQMAGYDAKHSGELERVNGSLRRRAISA